MWLCEVVVEGCTIEWRMRVGRRGLVSVNEMWGISFLRRGDLVGVGYTVFEAVGGCHWVRALVGAKNPKPSCRGSALVNETWGEGAFG